MSEAQPLDKDTAAGQRIDQWLWHARLFKTRTLAAKFVSEGHVRLTRGAETQRVAKPSQAVAPGDALAYSRNGRLRVIAIDALGKRRGPAAEAQTLYTDHSPPPPKRNAPPAMPFERERGAGRPTKKDRRALEALKSP